ncbi:hypothetical protein FB451DRAFT_1419910 [Mycena latifolia]|nr:hypothetical protein FB451DRAFT_1419910 [Mycena latifolia]
MSSSLPPIFGLWLNSQSHQALLYGTGLLQVCFLIALGLWQSPPQIRNQLVCRPALRSSGYSTAQFVNFRIMTAINRGATITVLLNLLLLTHPGRGYFLLLNIIGGKVYTNGILLL